MKTTLIAVFCVASCAIFGASGPKVPLWPEGKMPSVQENQPEKPYLIWHTPEKRTSDAILKSPINTGALAMLGGLVLVPIVNLFTRKPDKALVDGAFACYEKTTVVQQATALGAETVG